MLGAVIAVLLGLPAALAQDTACVSPKLTCILGYTSQY
jgi:hypothetical protein